MLGRGGWGGIACVRQGWVWWGVLVCVRCLMSIEISSRTCTDINNSYHDSCNSF